MSFSVSDLLAVQLGMSQGHRGVGRGAPKVAGSVDLSGPGMGTGGFCVRAEADAFRYESCFILAHEVKPQEAKAKFESGLLTITVPFKETIHGHKVPIE